MVGIARQRTRESDPDYEHEQLDMNEYEDPQRTPGSKINGGGEHSQHPAASGSSSFASGESTDDEAEHRQTVDAALKKLRQVHGSSTGAGSGGWEKALKHKHGVDVYVRKDTVVVEGREKKVPLWKGELLIEGFSPAAVFAVAGQRKLWDEWYDSGNLVADLSESSSLVYMVMKPPATARTRDLALVEKVEADADGSIFFAATSIVSPRIPGVHGRTRATMILNGWVLRPIQKNGTVATMTSYYVQADAQGFLPSTLASKIMARRPVEIYKIQEHLKRFGAPSNARAASQDQQRGASYAHSGGTAAVGPNETGPQPRHANSRAALAGQAPEHEHPTEGTLPPQAPFVDSHASSQEIKTAKRKFEEALSERSWSSAVDTVGSTIYFNRQSAGSSSSSEARGATLPTAKGAAELSGVTSEQILGTITSASARCVWDEMYVASELVENISGDAQHQGIFSQSRKGIHPHLPNQVYTVAHAALRDEPNSDDGAITYVSRSYSTGKDRDPSAPEGSVEFAGWRVAPSDTGREGSHTATYIASRTLTPSGQPIPDFVERILLAAEAGKPRRLKEFIDVHGHAPFFLRWSEGAAALDEEEEGDLSEGRTSWRIGSRSASGSKGSSKGTEQVAWLQWSEKMYPHGIALSTSERISGLKAAHIEGSDTTLQLTFPSEVPEKGFTLSLARGEGEHAGDVTWNGERVSESVSAPQGAAAARRRAPVTAATVVSSKAQEQQRRPEQAASALHGSNQQPQGGRAVAGATEAPAGGLGASLPPVVQDLAVLHHIPRGRSGTRTLPDDAMLILSQDLYFTRSQMGVIGALLALVWTLAKLT